MGAPVGNQNAAKGKMWHGAILRALDKRGAGDRLRALDELAATLLEKVAEGDLPALREFGDRIDGKPVQIIGGDPDGAPIQLDHSVRVLFGQ